MKYKFLYDTHQGSTNSVDVGHSLDLKDPFLIYGGDNFDLTNCKKDQVKFFQSEINRIKSVIGDRFISGNHEAQRDSDKLYIIPGTRTGVMHGDYIFWGKEKSDKYRMKKRGAGFLKRLFWVNALEAFENGYNRKISTEDLDRFYEYCIRKNVDRLVVGHLHPDKHLEIDYKGKRLTVCKRGLTELDLIQLKAMETQTVLIKTLPLKLLPKLFKN